MGSTFDALFKHLADDVAPVPVILPLSERPSAASSGPSADDPTPKSRNPEIPKSLSSASRFAFPEIPEPRRQRSQPKSPRAIWPDALDDDAETACAKAVNGMLHHISLERHTVVGLTSPRDGDGKTSAAVALAPQLAGCIAGNLLAVDANRRNRGLTSRLILPADESAGAASSLIYPTNFRRLSVLPAIGQTPPQRPDYWIEELRESWLLTLLDLPSLAHPEAVSLARLCDGVFLIARLGYTPRRAVSQAARMIRAGGRLLGCLVIE